MDKRIRIIADDAIPFLRGVLEPYADVRYMEGGKIAQAASDADALIIRTRTKCNEASLGGSSVRMVATATIGTDHIDLPWCAAAGIEVANAAGCNAGGVVDYVFSAMHFIAARKGLEISGKTLGIIGVGHVGGRVEESARRLGLRVLLCDPPRAAAEGDAKFCSCRDLLAEADIVTMHVPLAPDTRGMADESFFRAMKPGAVFINASRGEVVVDEALKAACPKLAGVAIDTWNGEPEIDRELLGMVDIATPHIAGYSYQGKQNGTTAAVRAVAAHFGIAPLKDWSAPGEEAMAAVDIEASAMGEDDRTAAFLQAYPISADDAALRANPEEFEHLRSHYSYRKEYNIR